MKIKILALSIALLAVATIVQASWFSDLFSKNQTEQTLSGTVIKVPAGGTGATSFSAGDCLIGAGTGAITTGSCGTGGTGVGSSTEPFMAKYFVATSTSVASQFPLASSTAISSTQFCLTGDTCIATWPTGGGSANPLLVFNPFKAGYFVATSTATSTFSGGIESSLISSPYFIATSTTASSTFYNGINLINGCFSVGGTCVGAGSGVTDHAALSNLNFSVAGHTGILPEANGGTASSSFGKAFYNYFNATTTTALTEGNNLYWTNTRFDNRLSASSSISGITTLPNLVSVGTLTTGTWNATIIGEAYGGTASSSFGKAFYNYFKATTTDALAVGSSNKYYTDALARVAFSSTATGLTYTSASGAFSLTTGYVIPQTATMNLLVFNPLTAGYYVGTSTASSTLSGGLNAGTLISAPYFVATSTTASSTLVGLNVLAINQNGTASSTFSNGINLTNGCFAKNGTCISGGGGVTDHAALSNLDFSVAGHTGILPEANGGTASSSFGKAFYNYFKATTTAALTEQTNLYYTDARADTRIMATTSIPTIWALGGLGSIGSSTATTTALGNLKITSYLDVAGTAATSTFGNGIQLVNGCFRMANGVCAGTGNGTVTSVAMTVPTGLTIAGSPITTSGTLALTLTAGYIIPTTAQMNLLTFNPFTAGYFIATSTGTSTIMAGLYGARVEAGYFYSTTTQASLISYGSSTAWTINSSGRLYIPANTNPVVNAVGDIGINTTAASSSIRFATSTNNEAALYPQKEVTITIPYSMASTSASTTVPLGFASRHGETWNFISCKTAVATAGLEFGDGTNFMTYMPLTTTKSTVTNPPNNTFTYEQARSARIGQIGSNYGTITCIAGITISAD